MTQPAAAATPAEIAAADPKGLIRESYAMDGITDAECRSILIDWALSLPLGADSGAAIDLLLGHYGAGRDAHPMNALLILARQTAAKPARRGGRAGRAEP